MIANSLLMACRSSGSLVRTIFTTRFSPLATSTHFFTTPVVPYRGFICTLIGTSPMVSPTVYRLENSSR